MVVHTHIFTQTSTHAQKHKQARTRTNTHSLCHTWAQAHTCTHTCAHSQTHTPTHPHTHTPTHPHIHTPAHPRTHSPTHQHTHTPTHPHTQCHPYVHAPIHAKHTHTRKQKRSYHRQPRTSVAGSERIANCTAWRGTKPQDCWRGFNVNRCLYEYKSSLTLSDTRKLVRVSEGQP